MIVSLREERNITQERLAKSAKVSRGYLAALEAGHKKRPALRILRRLAKALDVEVNSLLEETSDKEMREMAFDLALEGTTLEGAGVAMSRLRRCLAAQSKPPFQRFAAEVALRKIIRDDGRPERRIEAEDTLARLDELYPRT